MEEKDNINEVETKVEEEDSTVELRESYEEKTEEQPPKKKKKLSKGKIAFSNAFPYSLSHRGEGRGEGTFAMMVVSFTTPCAMPS